MAPDELARVPSAHIPAATRRATRRPGPTLRTERRLLRGGITRLAGMDEVGRGAPAGPATVGVVVVDDGSPPAPLGVRDSKLLRPSARESLVPVIEVWAVAWAVGHAEPWEVDQFGVTGALRLAGLRALSQLAVPPDLVLLDGAHDWLSPSVHEGMSRAQADLSWVPVVTKVKADTTCASVAAASVLAKVARDAIMVGLAQEHPDYGWDVNKGYGTAVHMEALGRLGPTSQHRLSWRLPNMDGST